MHRAATSCMNVRWGGTMMREMPRFPLHELEPEDIMSFVLHHYSTLYSDDADVRVGDDY
jgi:hypothetical protein